MYFGVVNGGSTCAEQVSKVEVIKGLVINFNQFRLFLIKCGCIPARIQHRRS